MFGRGSKRWLQPEWRAYPLRPITSIAVHALVGLDSCSPHSLPQGPTGPSRGTKIISPHPRAEEISTRGPFPGQLATIVPPIFTKHCFHIGRMLQLVAAALTVTLITLTRASPSAVCGAQIYGHPEPNDALGVAGAIPFAMTDPERQADAARVFAEPAFFTPKFSALQNQWQTSMVQLPMVWRYSKLAFPMIKGEAVLIRFPSTESTRLALLFSANDAGQVLMPSINLTWRVIQTAATGVLENCIQKQNGVGGVWAISGKYSNP